MEMNFGMGQWFLWGAVGMAAILSLFGITNWLRGNQKRSVSGSAGNADGAIISGVVGSQAKKDGWGVGPWALISLLLAGVLGWLVWTTSGMSGMSAIKWIFTSLLGLGALFTAMGFFQMIRRHPLVDEKRGSPRGLGFLTMMTGLVLAGASWFVWQPKIASLGGLSDRVSGYETDISNYKSQITGFESNETTLRAENTRLGGVVSDLKKKLSLNMADADEISRLAAVVKGLNNKTEKLEDENNRLKGLVSSGTANKGEISRLKGVISGLKTDVSSLDKDVTTKNTEIARLEESVAAQNTEINRLKGVLNKNGASDNSEITKLNGAVSSLTTENKRMNSLIGKYRNDSEVQNAKIASLEADKVKLEAEKAKIASLQTKVEAQQAEIETLRNKPAEIKTVTKTITVPAPPTEAPLTALQLLRKHGKKQPHFNLVNPDYRMTKIREEDLVNGKTGKYYRISLKSPDGQGYKFASGKYNKITPSAPFKASLDRVIEDIKTSLDGRRTYQIYTRGKASAGYFHGRMDTANAYNDIELLRRGANGKYDDLRVNRHYENKLTNEDLPNLRGAYLQDYIARNYPETNPVILEGKVSKSKDPSKQTVDIILYVEE